MQHIFIAHFARFYRVIILTTHVGASSMASQNHNSKLFPITSWMNYRFNTTSWCDVMDVLVHIWLMIHWTILYYGHYVMIYRLHKIWNYAIFTWLLPVWFSAVKSGARVKYEIIVYCIISVTSCGKRHIDWCFVHLLLCLFLSTSGFKLSIVAFIIYFIWNIFCSAFM